MSRLFSVLAIVWTLLLVGIAFELYRIDDSLMWLSAPNRNLARSMAATNAAALTPETEHDRAVRLKAESDRNVRDLEYRLGLRPAPAAPASGARPTSTPAARRP